MFSPAQLHVVTPVSNPLLTQSRVRLAREFCLQQLAAGVQLTLVECALGERAFVLNDIDSRIRHIGVRHKTICWHKENLINIGISRLPPEARYIAWIDADIAFRRPDWPVAIIHALQQYSVIQPWEHAYDLGPHGEHLELHTSFASLHVKRQPIFTRWRAGYVFGHPGYAWAARREIIDELGGLYEAAVLGSADHNMAMAMLGRAAESFPADVSAEFTASQLAWQKKAVQFIGYRLGYLPGTIEHGFHGPKLKRAYVSRWDILRRWKYNPVEDIKLNIDRVLELAGNKPGLQSDIERYFAARDEDSNQPT